MEFVVNHFNDQNHVISFFSLTQSFLPHVLLPWIQYQTKQQQNKVLKKKRDQCQPTGTRLRSDFIMVDGWSTSATSDQEKNNEKQNSNLTINLNPNGPQANHNFEQFTSISLNQMVDSTLRPSLCWCSPTKIKKNVTTYVCIFHSFFLRRRIAVWEQEPHHIELDFFAPEWGTRSKLAPFRCCCCLFLLVVSPQSTVAMWQTTENKNLILFRVNFGVNEHTSLWHGWRR